MAVVYKTTKFKSVYCILAHGVLSGGIYKKPLAIPHDKYDVREHYYATTGPWNTKKKQILDGKSNESDINFILIGMFVVNQPAKNQLDQHLKGVPFVTKITSEDNVKQQSNNQLPQNSRSILYVAMILSPLMSKDSE